MVTTNSEDIAGRLRQLRNHGFREKYHAEIVGGNFRLDEIQAAVLRVKLKYLDRWTEARQRNAALYRQKLHHSLVPVEKPGRRHIYNQFVIRSPRRDAMHRHLKAEGIASEVYYPVPLHLQRCYSSLGYERGQLPESERASQETLALPIYPELSPEMIDRIARSVDAV
jgi:dTDP-4-amino-4,6-dideoxygalactose transaminase